MRAWWQGVTALGTALWTVALLLFLAVELLIVIGLGVIGLSDLVGSPLPRVDDDPDRVEWGGLALLVLYGLARGPGVRRRAIGPIALLHP